MCKPIKARDVQNLSKAGATATKCRDRVGGGGDTFAGNK